ncbi:DUF808 domain-containing protein [Marinobacterium rhizophilum]|uniref:DUF808 domain-containing protein n=1 Tax=Marinobacterium rhizophilum TaxID=420402 RepID=A0ABY5HHK2_9GAMM|nr:DUF808 domain-containing protein [Marinobacterium rhizophilum]UTW10774.1 DUF808 domain-containing protein [Marinobacterium rhizophilum]
MAGTSLLALLDDIATVLDDITILSKVAAKKTAGVLGDDLALNAEQVTGVRAERELPVVWAVAKGSFKNKLVLVPGALLISVIAPWLILPMLMLGGAYLCFEGFEKIAHGWTHSREEEEQAHLEKIQALSDPQVDLVAFEKNKIRGAIRTDFVLSAEIIVIALGIVSDASFTTQVAVVSLIAFGMTFVVYSLVAGIVKLDDAGLHLLQRHKEDERRHLSRWLGTALLRFAPLLMKTLSIVGTAAMFLVGGGILVHGVPGAEDWLHHGSQWLAGIPQIGAVLAWFAGPLGNAVIGIVSGAILVAIFQLGQRLFMRKNPTPG